jgi:aldehyde:ferredoxin oxidoreductase
MASKNLKAIVINAAGSARVPNPAEFKGLIQEEIRSHQLSPAFPELSEQGTLGHIERANAFGCFPTRNFREGSLEGWEKMAWDEFRKIKVGNTQCWACMIHCGNIFSVKDGPYAGVTSEGPDYETVNMFTGSIGSTDIGATVAADAYCDEQGIDTISAGNAIGFAYELFEREILTRKDTGGLELTYGNYQAALELLRRIANREGLGDILAEGVKRAAEKIGKGAEAYAMHVKGLEMPAYDPRSVKWHGLNYITSPCGANHNLGYGQQEILNLPFPRPVDRFAEEGFADIVKMNQDLAALWDSVVVCVFAGQTQQLHPLTMGKMLVSVTGITDFRAPMAVFLAGERIFNLERAFNLREGFSRKDDVYPERFTTEPLVRAGPSEGQVIKDVEGMLNQYYHVRGWDQDGIPTTQKLKQLGLEEIEKDIRK